MKFHDIWCATSRMIRNKIFTPNLPPALSKKDAIGIVAPSSPFDRQKFDQGASVLKHMGYRLVVSDSLFSEQGYLAGSDRIRAQAFNACFADPDIRAIWCVRGGYGSMRILPLIDYDLIASNPKILIGCSDITALLNTVYARAGLVTFHGPMIASLGAAAPETIEGIEKAVSGEDAVMLKSAEDAPICPGTASGPVMGGNLSTLNHLLATPYEPDFSGHILLIEDIGEAPYRIDRMLSQMKMAGCFDKIAGVAAGSFVQCGDIEMVHLIIKDIFADLHIPVLAGLDFGHGDPNMTIAIGINARLDADHGILAVDAPSVLHQNMP